MAGLRLIDKGEYTVVTEDKAIREHGSGDCIGVTMNGTHSHISSLLHYVSPLFTGHPKDQVRLPVKGQNSQPTT